MAWMFLLLLCLHFHCTFELDEQTYNTVIIVNVNGSDDNTCCVDGHYECSSFENALNQIRYDSTLINITSSIVPLSSLIKITDHTTIGISGNNGTVISCNNTGGVSFVNCKNIDISGITWDQCGGTGFIGAVSVEQSSNIVINSCTFQRSINYGVTITSASGMIIVTSTNFSNNGNITEDHTGGLLIFQVSKDQMLRLSVINSTFENNGYVHCSQDQYGGGISVWTNESSASSLIHIENCTFLNNSAYHGAGIYVSAKQKNITLYLTKVYFENNKVGARDEGNAIYYYSDGSFANFIITNSTIVNSIFIQISSTNSSLSIYDSSFKPGKTDVNVNMELYSKNLFVNLSELTLVGTQVIQDITCKTHNCVLQFDKLTVTNNSGLQIDGTESVGFQSYITNSQFNDNNANNPVVDIYYSGHHPVGIKIFNCVFSNNSYGEHVVRLAYINDDITFFMNQDIAGNIRLSSNNNINNMYYSSQYPDINFSIEIFGCNFSKNNNGKHVVHLTYNNLYNGSLLGNVHLSHTSFNNNINNDNTLYLECINLNISGTVSFQNNICKSGAGMYFTGLSQVILSNGAHLTFLNNVAALGGGAIYADCPYYYFSWSLFSAEGSFTVAFVNNQAHSVGDSVFLNIPVGAAFQVGNGDPFSEDSPLRLLKQFKFSGSIADEIATSPYVIKLTPPAKCASKSCDHGGTYSIKDIMLGEEVFTSAVVVDYFNNTAETSVFYVNCLNCTDHTLKSVYQSFIYVGMSQNISIIGKPVDSDGLVLALQVIPVTGLFSDIPNIPVSIELSLSPCHVGYEYNIKKEMCTCRDFHGIVVCSNPIKIKKGYWYGTVMNKRAVAYCPNNYCDYSSCPVASEFCNISGFRCSQHRSGTGCGDCVENFTLPFDSDKCVPIDKCQIDRIIVIVITILYWIMTIFVVRLLMYFKTVEAITGYVYGIIFFYSVLEFIIGEDLVVSDSLMLFVTILSSIVNISPRFLERLCLARGLSGIDQEVIHYIHPLAIVLLLLIIARAANRSVRVTAYIGQRGVVPSICLLILLFYTSLSSTSWQLLKYLKFDGIDGVYTYLSPDIKYFSGRHIAYGLIAILCGIVMVLGLPFLLLFEPLLRRWFSFFKIKPLLDQFQGCYKAKCHCFAAFYLICRLLILVIFSLDMLKPSSRFLMLQILCLVIAMIHAWVQPYKNSGLNSLDLSILLIMLMIVSLNVGAPYALIFDSNVANDLIIAALVSLPLIMFIGFLLYSNNFCRGILFQRAHHQYVQLRRLVHKSLPIVHLYLYAL